MMEPANKRIKKVEIGKIKLYFLPYKTISKSFALDILDPTAFQQQSDVDVNNYCHDQHSRFLAHQMGLKIMLLRKS